MTDPQLFLLNIDTNPLEAYNVANVTAKRLERKEMRLIDLIESLGEYLTDEDTTVRSKAIQYLSAVLPRLSHKFLSKQQASILCQFLCNRLEDESGLKETAQGLVALQKTSCLTKHDAQLVATTLFSSVPQLQRHPQGTRYSVYALLDVLMSQNRDALKTIDGNFITSLCDFFAGEKDPRNLMIIFSILKVVMVEWDITKDKVALFDAVFCYFPITFRPPPDDPYGITAKDLKSRLRECLSSTFHLANLTFPALIEKLDAVSPTVKIDVMQTINACVLSYTPNSLADFSMQLWNALKSEISNAQEDLIVHEAISTLSSISLRLSQLKRSDASYLHLNNFLGPILNECNNSLREPQQKQAKHVGTLLGSLASASPASLVAVTNSSIPFLLNVHEKKQSIGQRKVLLNILTELIAASTKVFGTWSSSRPIADSENPLNYFGDQLFEEFRQALMPTSTTETSYRISAIKGFSDLSVTRGILKESEIGKVVQLLDEIVLSKRIEETSELKEAAIRALLDISYARPHVIMDISFPAFFGSLPDAKSGTARNYIEHLEALARLGANEQILEVLLQQLTDKFDSVSSLTFPLEYPHALLSSILHTAIIHEQKCDIVIQKHYDQLLKHFIRKATLGGRSPEHRTVLQNEAVLDTLGRLANVVIRSFSTTRQIETMKEIYTYFSPEYSPVPAKGVDLNVESSPIVLSTYLLAGLRVNIPLSFDIEVNLLNLISIATKELTPSIRLAALHQIALIVNKWLPASSPILEKISSPLFSRLDSFQNNEKQSDRILLIIFWITKAVILRGDPSCTGLLEKLCSLLNSPIYGLSIARAFVILLQPEDVMSSANNVIIRLLHKQRLFKFCMPHFTSASTVDMPVKENYLIALAGILKWTPSAIVIPEITLLLPLLLQSLDLSNTEVKATAIETLNMTITECPKDLEEHLGSLLGRLLAATLSGITTEKHAPLQVLKPQSKNCTNVRLAALCCLKKYPGAIRNELLLPYKKQVIRNLQLALDDPKRDVRRAAVECRAVWCKMDEPMVN
ncbi:MAG: hypothetical protein M1829_001511 [Trizodia sp. TS-e1964]|nr:MAG: hypothetical protein M1829_001511 [Trizodia sp. TS-e1964]